MNSLYRPFYHTFRWTAIESVTYEIMLLAHQFVLYQCVEKSLFGLIGAFIGLVYLFVYVLNIGFDKALSPYFQKYAQSKQSMRSLLFIHIIPTYLFIVGVITIAFLGLHKIAHYLPGHLSHFSFLLMGAIILVEVNKKIIKTILRLALLSHIAAPLELATLIVYLVGVWTTFAFTRTITFNTAIIPLLVSALFGSITMLFYTIKWYKTLPNTGKKLPKNIHKSFFKNRIHTFFLHINRQLFTTNFFIPLFAYFYGLSVAGTLKIASRLTSTVMVISRKLLETPTNVFFANTHNKDIEKQQLFSYASYWINQVAYAVIIFAIINHMKLFGISSSLSHNVTEIGYFGILYFIIRICGNFCISYEQFYIAFERPSYLVAINTTCLLLLSLILYYATSLTALTLLFIIGGVRIISCFIFALFSYYWWRIKPNWNLNPLCQMSALLFSLLFYYDIIQYFLNISNTFFAGLVS